LDDVSLGDRELDVMAVLWQNGSGTVTEVRDQLPVELAYTTVLTILRNLEAKEFVRHESLGKAHRYFPLVARHTAQRNALARILDKLFQGSPEALLTHLVDESSLTPAQLRRISNHIAKTPRKKGKSK
jgi:BlaI family penicillinase repressor